MRVLIRSNGSGESTQVVDARTGEIVEDVVAVSWAVGRAGVATVRIEIAQPLLDVAGEVADG